MTDEVIEVVVDDYPIVVVLDDLPIDVVITEAPIVVDIYGGVGPQGPPGQDGSPGSTFTMSFTNTNFVSVQHDLGYKPDARVYVAGEEIEVDVLHASNNLLTVSWNSAILSGEVVCS